MNTTAVAFIAFVAAWTSVLGLVIDRYHGRRNALRILTGLLLWLVYVGTLSRIGVVRDATARPPGITFVVGPLVIFFLWAVASPSARRFAVAMPIPLLIALQVFRVGVESFLARLWFEGLVPKTLTFEGDNVDVWLGVSAPIIAWIATKGPIGLRIAVAWNVAGLASLANVVVRSALTAPGPLHLVHAEVLNRAIGTFPYTLIAGFLAPSALLLHVLCLQAIRTRTADIASESAAPTIARRPTGT